MASTAETLRLKSENLKVGIGQLVNELRKTNDEIAAQMEQNKATVAQAEANIEQLHADNEELAALKADNETFISQAEDILAN